MRVLRLCSVFEPDPATLRGRGAAYDPIGGLQNHAGALTRALDELGVTQTVFTSRLGGPVTEIPVGDRATVLRVGAPIRHLRQLWAADAARRIPWRGPFDVVHAHQGEDLALLPLAVAAARRFDAGLVVSVHCSVGHTLATVTPRARLLRLVGAPIERWGLRSADRVVTLTERAAAFVAGDGVAADRISVIPSGFERALFDGIGLDGARKSHHPRRVGYVGRFAPQKDVVSVIQAFDLLRADAMLTLVGDGPDRPLVEAAIAATRRPQRIRCTGFVPHDRVPALLGEFEVMVLASRYEELGSVLVEGLRAGVPIVATAVGGIPEVVRHGETGLLVPPADPAALAGAIDLVLSDPGLAGQLSKTARAASEAYAWDDLARSVLTIYESVVRGETRSAAIAADGDAGVEALEVEV